MENKDPMFNENDRDYTVTDVTKKPKKAKREKLADGRRFRFGALSTALTAAVVVAVVLLNLLVSALDTKFPLSLDTTADKVLTLADETKDIAKSVNEPIKITTCIDESYFSSPNTGNNEMDTVLSHYYTTVKKLHSLSDGKISYSFVDLTKDITEAAALSSYDVSDGEILFTCGERSKVIGLEALMEYDDRYNQYLQYRQNGLSFNGDYSFTSLVEPALVAGIQSVQNATLAPVTMVVGHGEDQNVVTHLTDTLKKNGYEVLTLDITTMENTFDKASNMAILPAPSTDYSADELALLRAWASNNGGMNHQLTYIVNYATFLPSLSEFFSDNYGIGVTPYWVAETSNSRLFYPNQNYVFGDVAKTDYTAEETKVIKTPATAALKLHWDENSTLSQYVQRVVSFPETAQLLDFRKATEQYTPPLQKADSYPIVGMAYSRSIATVDGKPASTAALICGSSIMFNYLSDGAAQNKEVFLKVFNGLNGNKNAVSISGKSLSVATVDFGSDGLKKLLGLGVFTILLPVGMLICGLAVFLRRRNL